MPWTSKHINWLVDTGEIIELSNGKQVKVFEFRYQNDDAVFAAWAKHFRNHYCLDTKIDDLRKGLGFSRADYLNKIKFPDSKKAPGPSIRAGDFSEIMVSDFLEYLLGYWVPRTRYSGKTSRNESTKGCDVVGFHIIKTGEFSNQDSLAIFEVKAELTRKTAKNILQNAVKDSAKDIIRKAESLNAIKQRLNENNESNNAEKIERFQNEVDHPYKQVYGVAALYENKMYNKDLILSTVLNEHPCSDDMVLIIIKGNNLMSLVHELYERAANEA